MQSNISITIYIELMSRIRATFICFIGTDLRGSQKHNIDCQKENIAGIGTHATNLQSTAFLMCKVVVLVSNHH